jgi:hypothetical protein
MTRQLRTGTAQRKTKILFCQFEYTQLVNNPPPTLENTNLSYLTTSPSTVTASLKWWHTTRFHGLHRLQNITPKMLTPLANTVARTATSCSRTSIYRRFGGKFCIYLRNPPQDYCNKCFSDHEKTIIIHNKA